MTNAVVFLRGLTSFNKCEQNEGRQNEVLSFGYLVECTFKKKSTFTQVMYLVTVLVCDSCNHQLLCSFQIQNI